jgi:hypothetical protein
MKILRITTHWSAEEAECVYQLLDEFKADVPHLFFMFCNVVNKIDYFL